MDQSQKDDTEQNKFDHTIFKDYLKQKFLKMISDIQGQKMLYIEPCIYGPLNLLNISDQQFLENKIQGIRYLNADEIGQQDNKIVFFCTPKVEIMQRISKIILKDQINSGNNEDKQESKFSLILWPRKNILCKETLEEQGVYGNLKIRDFNFDLIPLENDLLSLEMNFSFRDTYIDQDLNLYQQIAESIQRLQVIYGKVGQIYGKGQGAKNVIDILQNEEKENQIYDERKKDISSLIILDRNIDFLTPMLLQLTYEGMIDEFIGIESNVIKVDSEVLNKKEKSEQVTIILNNNKQTYKDCRDLSFSSISSFMSKRSLEYQNIKNSKNDNKTVGEMTKYLEKYKDIQKEYSTLADHVNLGVYLDRKQQTSYFHRNLEIEQGSIVGIDSQVCLNHVQSLVSINAPLEKVLRLLCLQSLVSNGIKEKQLNYIKKEVIQSYGFEHMLTFYNLEKIGLLKKNESKNNWGNLKKYFNLIQENVDTDDPQDSSYVYAGLAPLMTRLVENVVQKKNWKDIHDYLDKYVPGPTVVPENVNQIRSEEKQFMIVYVIGGITRAEISSLRFIAKKENKEIIVCTSQILNGNKIMEMVQHQA